MGATWQIMSTTTEFPNAGRFKQSTPDLGKQTGNMDCI